MQTIPKRRLNDQTWLENKYQELKYQKNFYGNLFLAIVTFVAVFFFLPLPSIFQEFLPFWQMGLLIIFIMITLAWYAFSIKFHEFCENLLAHLHATGELAESFTTKDDVILFSNPQIVLYILLAVVIPIMMTGFLSIPVNYTVLYTIFGGFTLLIFIAFFMKIDDFYERRDLLDRQEVLVETILITKFGPTGLTHQTKEEKTKKAKKKTTPKKAAEKKALHKKNTKKSTKKK